MAQTWESDAIKAAGQRWQAAQKRGDQQGMAAAQAEADRLRRESGYDMAGGQANAAPRPNSPNAWNNSGAQNAYKQYKEESERNSGQQSNGNVQKQNRNGYDDMLSNTQQAYQKMLDDLREQNRLAVEQGVNRLESNRSTINQGYDEAARQAYIAKMQSQQHMPQALAAQGLTGGASESARLALETGYGENINANEQARQNALTGLDQSITDLRNSGDLNLAQQQLALQQQGLADYNNAYAQKIQQDNYLKQFEQNQADKEFQRMIDLIPAHSDDYTAYINELRNNDDPDDDRLIPYVQIYRNGKVSDMQSAQAAAEQQAFENWMAYQKLNNNTAMTNYQINRPYFNPKSGGGSGAKKTSQAGKTQEYNQMVVMAMDGELSASEIERNRSALIMKYGPSKYQSLLKHAKENGNGYKPSGDPVMDAGNFLTKVGR